MPGCVWSRWKSRVVGPRQRTSFETGSGWLFLTTTSTSTPRHDHGIAGVVRVSSLLQEYLARSAYRNSEKVALVMGGERLTYGELELESNHLASLLTDSGCVRGDRVCLLLPKSSTAIAAMIGVLKAGAAYVPVDVSSPAPRVESIIRACEPRLVLASGETAELAAEL